MKITGITAEYNPFHNGHKYHIEKTRELTGADCVVAVMSGNFTQRGEAAVLDKWHRSMLAVDNGVDMVIELPFTYACNRAEVFAEGAIDILKGIGANIVSFGSESGDISALKLLADGMVCKEKVIAKTRDEAKKKGFSFAAANYLAVEKILGRSSAELISKPNNILALEYLKRIAYWNMKGHAIEAVTVKRHGSGYFDYNEKAGFAGASKIRTLSERGDFEKYVPRNVADALDKAVGGGFGKSAPLRVEEEFYKLVRNEIVKSSPGQLKEIYCMGEGLENKLKKEAVKADNMRGFLNAVVSKRYTEAAIRRLMVYVLLGIREYEPAKVPYARVLAANESGRKLLNDIKKSKDIKIPVITNINKYEPENEMVAEALGLDVLAADMYNLISGGDLYNNSDKVKRPYMGKTLENMPLK